MDYPQTVKQTSKGAVLSLHNGIPVLSDVFQYPLQIDYTTLNENGTACASHCPTVAYPRTNFGIVTREDRLRPEL